MVLGYAKSSFDASRVVVTGIPYDRTSSFVPGSRFGPQLIRVATENTETYSPYQRRDLSEVPVHDCGDLTLDPMNWPEVSAAIREHTTALLSRQKLPIFLGGEHSITPPIVAACQQHWHDLVVVQFDAHADLRSEFLGEAHSHATAMHWAAKTVGLQNIYQYGIRSGTQEEFLTESHLHAFEVLAPIRRTKDEFQQRPVYLSIDIDVLDPGVMPAVSTPEPGGIDYRELIAALLELRDCRIVGADIVEYNPLANRDPAGAALIASLLRELILTVTANNLPLPN